MADISSFGKAKDWLLGLAVTIILGGLSYFATDNRRQIDENQTETHEELQELRKEVSMLRQDFYRVTAERVTRLEIEVQELRRDRDRDGASR